MSHPALNYPKYQNPGLASSLDYYSTYQNYDSSSQIAQLETKMTQHEFEYTQENKNLQNRVKELIISETNYKNELKVKEEELLVLKQNYKSISNENDFNHNKLNEALNKLRDTTEVYNNIQEDYNKLYDNRQLLLEEIAEWKEKNNIILYAKQEQENEISALSQILGNYKSNWDGYEAQLSTLNKERDNHIKLIQSMKAQQSAYVNEISKLSNIKRKLDTEIKIISEDKCANELKVEVLTKENKTLIQEKYTLEEAVAKLETTLNKQTNRISELERENDKINESKTLNNTKEMTWNSEIIRLKGENANFVEWINDSISSVSHWIDNYLTITYSSNVQIPEITMSTNESNPLLSKINLSVLTKSLVSTKTILDKQSTKDKNELKEIKTNLLKCQEKNCKLNKDLEDIYTYISNELDIGGYIIEKNSKQSKVFSLGEINYKASIDDWLSKVFILMKRVKVMSNETNVKNVIDDNCNLMEILEKLKYDWQSSEKRNQMWMNEIDLKKACIKSQNEIIKRRNGLEEDNQKLWKDNVSLINRWKVWEGK